jgi:hypothetical protein
MTRVERFFHIRTGSGYGGATVRVVGDTEIVGQVDVQVAFCHSGGGMKEIEKTDPNTGECLSRKMVKFRGDPFCKKEGRSRAAASPMKVVPLRYLPAELGRIEAKALKMAKRSWAIGNDFTFAIKYFLPKE